jgi:YD repeat-containing protein
LVSGVIGVTEQLFEYDGLSRVTFDFDDNGSLGGIKTFYSYDSLSRSRTETQDAGDYPGTVQQSYDANSNMATLSYPHRLGSSGNDSVQYFYDELDRVSSINLNSASTATYTFAGPGRVATRRTNLTTFDFVDTAFSFDATARVQQIQHSNFVQPNSNDPLTLTFVYAYDRMGNPMLERSLHEAVTATGNDIYSYDSAYRLIAELRNHPNNGVPVTNNTAPNPITIGNFQDFRGWLLDGVSNRRDQTDQVGSGGTPTTLSRLVNTVNEYTQVGSTGRSHDDNGNLIDDGTFTYHYDALNRLVEVRSGSNLVTRNNYDAKSRRTRHLVSNSGSLNQNRVYYYAGQRLIEEYDIASSTAIRSYVMGGIGERVLARTYNGSVVSPYAYLEKLDGSIVGQVDVQSELATYFDYRVQGLVEAVDPGSDGDFFTSDDGVMAVDGLRGSFFGKGLRLEIALGQMAFLGGRIYDFYNQAFTSKAGYWGLFGNGFLDRIFRQDGPVPIPPTTPIGPCPLLAGPPDATKDAKEYNCAGLAFRSYVNIDGLAVARALEKKDVFRELKSCNDTCNRCEVKFWHWTIDFETEWGYSGIFAVAGGGKIRQSNALKSRMRWSDFHIVSEQNLGAGAGPNVFNPLAYSKNGHGPVEGPGKAASFRPKGEVGSALSDEPVGYNKDSFSYAGVKIPLKDIQDLIQKDGGALGATGISNLTYQFRVYVASRGERCFCVRPEKWVIVQSIRKTP